MKTNNYYWLESLTSSLESLGILSLLTKDQLETVANDLAISHENYDYLHGSSCAANPLESELNKLKMLRERDREEFKVEKDALKKNLAEKIGVEPHRIGINNFGQLEVSRT